MSEFSAQIQGMNTTIEQERAMARRLADISDAVMRVKNNLNFDIRQRASIDARLRQAASALDNQGNTMTRAAQATGSVVSLYEQVERRGCDVHDAPLQWVSPNVTVTYDVADDDIGSLLDKLWDIIKKEYKKHEWILKLLKLGKDGPAGIIDGAISYIKSLVEFLTGDKKGLSGAADLCDLGSESVGLWKGLYDYLKDIYKDKPGAENGIFSKGAQQGVVFLGIAGALAGSVKSFLDAVDGLNKGDQGLLSDIAGFLDFGKDSVSLVGEVYGLEHLGDVKSLATKDGLYSPLMIYMTLAKTGFTFGSQMLESIEEYSKDGWDAGDTGAVMVDAAVEGIYCIANGLTFGVADALFGLINEASGGEPLADGETYGERAAEGLKAGADYLSDKIKDAISSLKKCFA